jgi:hypothetical protein
MENPHPGSDQKGNTPISREERREHLRKLVAIDQAIEEEVRESNRTADPRQE